MQWPGKSVLSVAQIVNRTMSLFVDRDIVKNRIAKIGVLPTLLVISVGGLYRLVFCSGFVRKVREPMSLDVMVRHHR